jgi:hypothetical protein
MIISTTVGFSRKSELCGLSCEVELQFCAFNSRVNTCNTVLPENAADCRAGYVVVLV